VPALAAQYIDRALAEVAAPGRARVLVGNGEPTIVVTASAGAPGKGGRSTHLALLVARGIAGLHGAAFLAAGTDDRDGSTAGAGAVVDGATWPKAVAAGLDPQAALDACDSARPLGALGCLVCSPGTSNLLDVHLLGVSGVAAV
jgi:hydroxypyruvate reductase